MAASAPVYMAEARTVFIGTALRGPVAQAGSAGVVLTSPARFRVVRYLKGTGPAMVTVRTAVAIRGNGTVFSEDGIEPRVGERWRIYTASVHMPYETSLCGGSCVMSGSGDDVSLPCQDAG